MAEKPTLVIGDVHGHHDRLETLLEREGIVKDGERVNRDVRVIQVGDLGNFGTDYTADEDCYKSALDGWIDTLIWGNHDRAVFDARNHSFGGYREPIGPVKTYMSDLIRQGRYLFATAAHGYLVTHAGLGRYFDPFLPADVQGAVEMLNNPPATSGTERDLRGHYRGEPDILWAAVNAIGHTRGGSLRWGGILWRDISESLSSKFNQVFGHSADHDGLVRHLTKQGASEHDTGFRIQRGVTEMDAWCVDIGGKYENRLAGIWLPSREIVKIDLDEE